MPSNNGLAVLNPKHLVEKRNLFNQVYAHNMTLQQCRFLAIYLSKINSRDTRTRRVRFPIDDFLRIMDLKYPNLQYLKDTIDGLLCQIIEVPIDTGGFTKFQMFKECTVSRDADSEQWWVEIDAHDKALSMFFGYRDKYFKYQLWNALKLKSVNQVRMYELLKEYQGLGYREFDIDDLRKKLGILHNEYPRFGDFKNRVLDVCKIAMENFTDLRFTYEAVKRGKAGKILKLGFHIHKNKGYTERIGLGKLIPVNAAVLPDVPFCRDDSDCRKCGNKALCYSDDAAAEMAVC